MNLSEIEAALEKLPVPQQDRLLSQLTKRRDQHRKSKPFNFVRTLAAAAKLPDLTPDEFKAFENELNRPLPLAEIGCD